MTKDKEIQFEQPSELLIIMNRYLMVIIAIIIVGLLSLGYFFLLAPKIATIKEIEKETSDIEERRVLNENLLTKIKELEKTYDEIIEDRENQLSYLMKVIPEEPQIAELFVMTERLAKQAGFDLQSINISEVQNGTGPDNAGAIAKDEDVEGEEQVTKPKTLKSVVIHITVSYGSGINVGEEGDEPDPDEESGETPYEAFKQYLVDLENNLRLMDIQSVNFGSLDQDSGSSLSFSFDIITYYK